MLMLKRKPNERITIGQDVEVIVLSVEGNAVVLGVEAPREVAVRREGPRALADGAVARPAPRSARPARPIREA